MATPAASAQIAPAMSVNVQRMKPMMITRYARFSSVAG